MEQASEAANRDWVVAHPFHLGIGAAARLNRDSDTATFSLLLNAEHRGRVLKDLDTPRDTIRPQSIFANFTIGRHARHRHRGVQPPRAIPRAHNSLRSEIIVLFAATAANEGEIPPLEQLKPSSSTSGQIPGRVDSDGVRNLYRQVVAGGAIRQGA